MPRTKHFVPRAHVILLFRFPFCTKPLLFVFFAFRFTVVVVLIAATTTHQASSLRRRTTIITTHQPCSPFLPFLGPFTTQQQRPQYKIKTIRFCSEYFFFSVRKTTIKIGRIQISCQFVHIRSFYRAIWRNWLTRNCFLAFPLQPLCNAVVHTAVVRLNERISHRHLGGSTAAATSHATAR